MGCLSSMYDALHTPPHMAGAVGTSNPGILRRQGQENQLCIKF